MAESRSIPSLFLSGEHRQNSLIFTERLLRSMAREKTTLLIFFETHIHLVYTSMVLAVDRDQNSLLLDPLNPEEGNVHLVQGRPLILYGKSTGIETGFRARIQKLTEISSGQVLQLEFPHETYHCQRREALRVGLPSDLPPIRISTRNGHQELARLADLGEDPRDAIGMGVGVAVGHGVNGHGGVEPQLIGLTRRRLRTIAGRNAGDHDLGNAPFPELALQIRAREGAWCGLCHTNILRLCA